MKSAILSGALTVLALLACPAFAEVTATTVLDGLDNPSGVAIQPDTGHVFVSDSGAAKVIRVVDGKAQVVISGFPQDIYGKGPMYNIGPLGLAFLDKDTLVVGGGGQKDGDELLRIYTIPAAGEKAISADNMKGSFSLPPNDEIKGEGNFYGLAANERNVYATSNGDDTKGWVARLRIRKNGKFGKYDRFIATKEATEVDAPVAITLNSKGQIVVGQMGEINVPNDGLLTYYNSKNGKMLMNLETGLYDITALAYGPGGQLYATDFAWMATEEGGLFQLKAANEGGEQVIEAVKVLALDKPAAMVAAGSTLYVTVFGTAEEGSSKKPGKLLKISL